MSPRLVAESQYAIPDGTYRVFITDAEEKVGKKSGNTYLQLEYTISGGHYDGRKVKFQNYHFQEGTTWRFQKLWQALINRKLEKGESYGYEDPRELVGQELIVELSYKKRIYEGKEIEENDTKNWYHKDDTHMLTDDGEADDAVANIHKSSSDLLGALQQEEVPF